MLSIVRCACLAAAFIVAPTVRAEPFDAATRSALQTIITRQLDAFRRDDAQGAEVFATPAIQDRFPPPQFLDMVKEHYAALLKPKSTTFGATDSSPDGPRQTVTIVAADGLVWTAVYSFEQIKGEWRISGCSLTKAEGEQAI